MGNSEMPNARCKSTLCTSSATPWLAPTAAGLSATTWSTTAVGGVVRLVDTWIQRRWCQHSLFLGHALVDAELGSTATESWPLDNMRGSAFPNCCHREIEVRSHRHALQPLNSVADEPEQIAELRDEHNLFIHLVHEVIGFGANIHLRACRIASAPNANYPRGKQRRWLKPCHRALRLLATNRLDQ